MLKANSRMKLSPILERDVGPDYPQLAEQSRCKQTFWTDSPPSDRPPQPSPDQHLQHEAAPHGSHLPRYLALPVGIPGFIRDWISSGIVGRKVQMFAVSHFLHVYPRTPDSSGGSIPKATICYMGIDPYVMFFEHQD